MKKTLILFAAVILSASMAFAQSKTAKPTSSELHADIHTFLNQYFPNVGVQKYELDWNGPEIKAFELLLNSGDELTFNRDGKWIEVDMAMNKNVPNGIAPEAISVFVKEKHKGVYITQIEKEHTGYEVTLSNGTELDFTQTGEYLGMNK